MKPAPKPVSAFRDDIDLYHAPDRDKWKFDHGADAVQVAPHDVPLSLLLQVQSAVKRDAVTISRAGVIEVHQVIQDACERLEMDLNLPATSLVFYDPKDCHFWIYPNADARKRAGAQ